MKTDDLQVTNLPPREAAALWHICNGLTAKEAARLMQCSHRTVESLINACMQRLGATNRVHLIAKAFQQGFLRVGMAVLIVSTLFSLAPSPAAADDEQVLVRKSRRLASKNLRALPLDSDPEPFDLTRPHDLLWDGALYVVYL